MATKSAKIGDKRKAAAAEAKPAKKSAAKKDAPQSKRQLWQDKNGPGSNDDSSADEADGGAELPAKKKLKQAKGSQEPGEQPAKNFEKGICWTACQTPRSQHVLTVTRGNLQRIPYQAEATRQRTKGGPAARRGAAANEEDLGAPAPEVPCAQGRASTVGR